MPRGGGGACIFLSTTFPNYPVNPPPPPHTFWPVPYWDTLRIAHWYWPLEKMTNVSNWKLILKTKMMIYPLSKYINNDLKVAHPHCASLSTWFLVELEFGNVSFWGEGKTGVPGEKPSWQGREPTTNSTHIHGVDAGIWTRATLVGGEWFHLCATLALISKLKNVQTHTVFIDFLSLQVMDERNCFQHFCPLHLQCLTWYWFREATTPDSALFGDCQVNVVDHDYN